MLCEYPNAVADVYCWKYEPLRKYITAAVFNQGQSNLRMLFFRPRVISIKPGIVRYDFMTPYVRMIQRAVGRWAKERLAARRLALAMGMHDRLGIESGIQVLGSDVLLLIIN
jgi:hypothetical protein